ncbi:hypothetical protein Patl1_28229 [Pistacia atlantica]|uniref:Uncharacterized protein n=1 Tax=Pistacia atlantica TaxID=434234 RepID=A0ACC1BG74_9ROSI|nr:hypothetical protein Patl1_28229 [Pistacia atlantica]
MGWRFVLLGVGVTDNTGFYISGDFKLDNMAVTSSREFDMHSTEGASVSRGEAVGRTTVVPLKVKMLIRSQPNGAGTDPLRVDEVVALLARFISSEMFIPKPSHYLEGKKPYGFLPLRSRAFGEPSSAKSSQGTPSSMKAYLDERGKKITPSTETE